MGTISNIMQTIAASQERSVRPKVSRRPGWVLLPQEEFLRVLSGEKKRSERFAQHMIFMQLSDALGAKSSLLSRLAPSLSSVVRETDIAGWFEPNSSLGVIFTELGDADVVSAERVIKARIASLLETTASRLEFAQLQMSFRAFCDDWTKNPRKEPPTTAVVQRTPKEAIRRKLRIFSHIVGSRQPRADNPGSSSF